MTDNSQFNNIEMYASQHEDADIPLPTHNTSLMTAEDYDDSSSSSSNDTGFASRSITSTNKHEIDQLVESLFDVRKVEEAIESDESSTESDEEESSTMSSILPSDSASHIHPTPMEIIPEIPLRDSSDSFRNECGIDDRSQQHGIEKFSSQLKNNTTLFPRKTEDRPLEVFVDNQSRHSNDGIISRGSDSKSQRYRSSVSYSRRRAINSEASISGNSVDTNGLSTIFRSIDLNTQESVTDRTRNSRRIQERMLNLRVGMLIIFLVSLTFLVVQMTAVTVHDANFQRQMHVQQESYILRSHNAGSIRGGPNKMPSTLNAFTNPVHVSNALNAGTTTRQMSGALHGPVDNLPNVKNSDNLIPAGQENILSVAKQDPLIPETNVTPSQEDEKVTGELPSNKHENISGIDTQAVGSKDVPFFWSIPQSGAETIKEVLKLCTSAVIASEAGGFGHESDTGLKTVSIFDHAFVNVDVSSTEGIQRAKNLNLVSSGIADVIVTPLFRDALQLYDDINSWRGFTLIRHPLERAVSTYNNLKRIKDPSIGEMSIIDYALSSRVENNWMVRYLSGKIQGELNEEHLKEAKEVLRTKFIVGISERKKESMKRFESYFGFQSNPSTPKSCVEQTISSFHEILNVEEGSKEWSLLEWQNKLDLDLYEYSLELFQSQGEQFLKNEISIS